MNAMTACELADRQPLPIAVASDQLEQFHPGQCGSTARKTVGGLTARQRDKVARLARQHEAEYDISVEGRGHEGLRQQGLGAGRWRVAA